METVTPKSLASRILYTKFINWKGLQFIQQNEFKDLTDVDRAKLKQSLVQNQFVEPFYVWESPDGILYCLDGKHRSILLQELIADGVQVPEHLPATFIDCKDKHDAAQLVLIFSSTYAMITRTGIEDFVKLYELDMNAIMEQASFPMLSFDEPLPMPDVLDGEPKDKPATMKITCESVEQLQKLMPSIDKLLKAECPTAYFSVSYGEI